MRIIPLLLVLFLASGLVGAADAPSFEDALAAHFDTIQARDLDAFTATLTQQPGLTLIFPGGQRLTTRQGVIDMHREWFANMGWTWTPEVMGTMVGADLAHALVRYTYTDADGSRQRWLSLLFRLEDGAWRLVYDQNTPVPADAE